MKGLGHQVHYNVRYFALKLFFTDLQSEVAGG